MALDAALAGVRAGGAAAPGRRRLGPGAAEGAGGRPTLRFYGWARPAVSIGYRQPLAQLDLAACGRLGYAVVRRPSGGGAVLHGNDLTYAVVLPRTRQERSRPLDLYQAVHAAFARGLRRLGLAATATAQAAGRSRPPAHPACFAMLGNADVSLAGFKVVGSAQRRLRGAILLQGSIPLRSEAETYARLLAPTEGPSPADYARGLNAFAAQPLSAAEVRQALIAGLREELDLTFSEESPLPEEEAAARDLALRCFGSHAWTERC
ncbi:MAG: lipoate--protein ligase family protein [Candidatus Tectomicrobia bacterium]|nr:lipoate--protein ligase family protein [Candidatus Tectomicrobia bacterium]